MRPPTTPPHILTLIVLTAITTASLNLFLPALPSIAADLRTDYATASWAISGYLAATGVVQLLAGPLSDRVGRRPVVLGALAIFAGASAGCALADDIATFLSFRMAQSVAVSGFAMSLAIVRDTTQTDQATSRIGTITAAMAIVPMLGPVLGGAIDVALGWRAIFWLYTAVGLGLLTLCFFDLGETRVVEASNQGHDRGRLLRAPAFWGFAFCTAFSTSAFYVFLAGAPLVATKIYGLSAAVLGMIVGSITFGFILGSTISARFGARIGPMPLILSGRSVACVGLGLGVIGALVTDLPVWLYFAATWTVGLGNGLTMPGSNALALSVEPRAAGTAAGLSGALTVFSGAALTGLTGWMIGGAFPQIVLLILMLAASSVALVSVLLMRPRTAPL